MCLSVRIGLRDERTAATRAPELTSWGGLATPLRCCLDQVRAVSPYLSRGSAVGEPVTSEVKYPGERAENMFRKFLHAFPELNRTYKSFQTTTLSRSTV